MTNPAPTGTDQRTRTGRARADVARGGSRASRWSRCKVVAAATTVAAVAFAPVALGEGPAQASPTASASASANEPCLDNVGITVVIDFQELGGEANVRCAPGSVVDGFDALNQAGINYQTARNSPGFVCKIAGLPSNDPCINPSPAGAYWSYWIAPRGGQWCYSNLGAAARTRPLPPGSIEGWSFSQNRGATAATPPRVVPLDPIPGQAPNQIPRSDCDGAVPKPPNPGPPPTTPSTGAPDPSATDPSGGAGAGTPGAGTGTPGTSGGPGPAGTAGGSGAGAPGGGAETPDTSVGDGTTTTVVEEAAPGEDVVGAPEAPDEALTAGAKGLVQTNPDGSQQALGDIDLSSDGSSKGNLAGVVLAVGAIVLLGGGAVLITRRRRTAGSA